MKIASDEKLAHTIGVRLVCMEMCEWMGGGGVDEIRSAVSCMGMEWGGHARRHDSLGTNNSEAKIIGPLPGISSETRLNFVTFYRLKIYQEIC